MVGIEKNKQRQLVALGKCLINEYSRGDFLPGAEVKEKK